MSQRMWSFALLCAVWLAPFVSVSGQTTVNYDFEDGALRGTRTQMKVPPIIITEAGNTFMRITGSAGDKQAVPSTYPNRNRSTVTFTAQSSSMPLITDANRRQTYRADIRYHKAGAFSGVTFELYQAAPGGESGGYGTRNGTGPVFIMYRKDGHVFMGANYANETKRDTVDLGPIALGRWHTYMVKAVWSHNPSQGRLEFYLDSTLKKTITGRDVMLGPESNRLPMLKLGMYGDHAVGAIDVDNVYAGPPDTSLPPSLAIITPTELRVVSDPGG